MKAAKTQKHLKEIPYPPKKAFKKKRKHYTSKVKCPNFTNFFRMPKINNSNLLKFILRGAAKISAIFPK